MLEFEVSPGGFLCVLPTFYHLYLWFRGSYYVYLDRKEQSQYFVITGTKADEQNLEDRDYYLDHDPAHVDFKVCQPSIPRNSTRHIDDSLARDQD